MHILKIEINLVILFAGLVFFGSTITAQAAITVPVSSVVKIFVGSGDSTKPESTWNLVQAGSGFVVDSDRKWIMTNAHVITQPVTYNFFPIYKVCTVSASSDSYDCSYTAKALYADVSRDLGLIQINGNIPGSTKMFSQPAIDLGASRLPNAAENIYVAGFPSIGGNTITISQGIVSGYENDPEGAISALKTDSNLIHGMSGGIAVDSTGAFVGIPSGNFTNYSDDRVGHVIVASVAQSFLADMRKQDFSSGPVVFIPFPTAVEGVTIKKMSSTSVQISWKPSTSSNGIKGYIVSYSTSNILNPQGPSMRRDAWTTSTQMIINDLDPSKTYYFLVQANDKADNAGLSSIQTVFSMASTPNVFPDVPTSHHNYYAIKYLKEHSVVAGYPDGTFKPGSTINRAELVKIVIKGQGIDIDPSKYNNCFPDVKDEWFASAVCYAKVQGWVAGYPDGTFKPAQDVNLVESLKILQKAYALPADILQLSPLISPDIVKGSPALPVNLQNQWFSTTLSMADIFGILDGQISTTNPAEKISRAKTAEHLYRIIRLGNLNKDFQVSGWSDSDGKPYDLIRYYGLNKTYQKFVDENNDVTEVAIAKKCSVALTDPCYTVTISNNGAQTHTEEIALKNNLLKAIKADGVYLDPAEIELASFNTLNYFHFKTPLEIKVADGSVLKVIDGVRSIKGDNAQSIQTFAGKKSARGIAFVTELNCESTVNGITTNYIIKSESLQYFVADMGQVKATSFITIEKDGNPLTAISSSSTMTEVR